MGSITGEMIRDIDTSSPLSQSAVAKSMIKAPSILYALVVVLALTVVSSSPAQEMAVPVEVQMPLLFKVLSYDHNLLSKAKEQLVVGILFQGAVASSSETKDAALRLHADGSLSSMDGIPLEFVPIDISEDPDWPAKVAFMAPDILYVAPLRGVAIQSVATITRAHQIATITGIPEYVDRGLGIGIAGKEDKPQIVINLPASKAEGLNIGSQALKLARLVGKEGKHIR
jgi:hypothetical protein